MDEEQEPIGLYFKGKGFRVYAEMKKRYGPKKGKEIFYATANARHMKPAKRGKRD